MKRIGVLTSGGDSPGMNPALRSVVRSAIVEGMEVYGIADGYRGLLEGKISPLDLSSVADIIHRGGTVLGTSRSDEFQTPEGVKKAVSILKDHGIEGLVVLGGDGSFQGALSLAKQGIHVVGVPCTIDNDLGYTDYTIGFFTAVNTVTQAISHIRDTSGSHGRASVVEVMGRHCGDIALYSGIAGGAESIIIPEKPFSMEEVSKKTLAGKLRGKRHHIIVLAEGVGKPYEVARHLEEYTGIDTRVTILGHIQRGGSPTVEDRMLATAMGYKAVKTLQSGAISSAVGIVNHGIVAMELEKALAMKRELNEDLYRLLDVVSS